MNTKRSAALRLFPCTGPSSHMRPFPGPGGKWQISTGGGPFILNFFDELRRKVPPARTRPRRWQGRHEARCSWIANGEPELLSQAIVFVTRGRISYNTKFVH